MVAMDVFAHAFGLDSKSDDVWTTLGKVTAVSGNTLSVLLGGSATPTECEAYCVAGVGDIVFVVVSKGNARAIACKGGDESIQGTLPVSNGGTGATNAADARTNLGAVSTTEALLIKSRATGDFNDLTTTGIYYTHNGMTANKPTTSQMYAYILVFGWDSVTMQLVVNHNNAVYVRTYSGSTPTWSSWATL